MAVFMWETVKVCVCCIVGFSLCFFLCGYWLSFGFSSDGKETEGVWSPQKLLLLQLEIFLWDVKKLFSVYFMIFFYLIVLVWHKETLIYLPRWWVNVSPGDIQFLSHWWSLLKLELLLTAYRSRWWWLFDLEVLLCDLSSWWPLASSCVWTPSCTSSPCCLSGCCLPCSASSPCRAVASGQSLNTHSPTCKHTKQSHRSVSVYQKKCIDFTKTCIQYIDIITQQHVSLGYKLWAAQLQLNSY